MMKSRLTVSQRLHVLVVSGGGWRGAFSAAILQRVMEDEDPPDLLIGTSVGAINLALASQGDFGVLRRIWSEIDDGFAIDGIKGFLALNLRGPTIYTLEPMRKLLQAHVQLARLRIPLRVGVVSADEDRVYTTMGSSEASSDDELHSMIVASSAMAPLMRYERIGERSWWDGGHLYAVPLVALHARRITAILHEPIVSRDLGEHRATSPTTLAESMAWSVETQLSITHRRALDDLQRVSSVIGMPKAPLVKVYAPLRGLGGILDARRETIERRWKLGENARPRGLFP